MTTKTEFRIRQKGSPARLYRFIQAFGRAGRQAEDVVLQAEAGESLKRFQILSLAALCRASGLKRSRFGEVGTYGFLVSRKYEDHDFAACEILVLSGVRGAEIESFPKRDESARLLLGAKSRGPLKDMEMAEAGHRILVSRSLRNELEQNKFRGLAFLEVKIVVDGVAQVLPSHLEIATTITLPKLANTDRLKCYGMGPSGKVEAFTGDYSRMVFVDDPPYSAGEPHYRRRDLQVFGQFDVAETFERLWIPQRSLVISQRLYRFLLDRCAPISVQPVRIDPD